MELKIVVLRKKQQMTQRQLADLCSTTQQQIAKIENGHVDPQLSTLARLAKALGCGLKDLFYSKSEFLTEIRSAANEAKIDLKATSLLQLNSVSANLRGTPSLHPYWAFVEIKNNKILFASEEK